ncbi:general glycosylation pathway protein [candidate division WOR-3 bacterium RBG_13_43_14]|uniref:General glycosylation pathway protein n=1 Tax=candidate division WOR-3 bacterium RBG_13_43_14 TaxID=1802590 RepID=A0A1F4UG52_UNCW3|nr:MAG: general glycosylation pathway protein [candidate division WOR-3 bacterium RBG_13_43_14]
MKIRIGIPYGRENIYIQIEEKHIGEIIYPNDVTTGDEETTLKHALENPVQSSTFDDFINNAGDIIFLVNDATRPTPTAKILKLIHHQIKDKKIKFLIATGMHRAPTEEEKFEIFGELYNEFRDRIFSHDSKKDEDMVYLGASKNGTEMFVNKMAVDAQKIVIIGSVEPHYFAGYTGGRKSFLPGIASYKTIEQNHKLALKTSAKALSLTGNPVHEDMEDAIQTIKGKEIFAIMTVLDRYERIYAATAGDITESLKAAIDKAHRVFSVEIKEKADIVVAVAPYPMDIDLYQSQKALDNGKLALNDNGILIMISKCRMGIGSETFVKLLSSCRTPQDTLDKIDKEFKLGYHKAAKMAEIARWAQMWAVTSLDDDLLNSIFLKPFKTIQEAINTAIAEKGDEKILFLMNASLTVPKLRRTLVYRSRKSVYSTIWEPRLHWRNIEMPILTKT